VGDRGNIAILTEGKAPLYIYTHWGGTELPDVVARVLSRRQRLNDPQYLARITFCELIPRDDWDGETGYGVSTYLGDNSYPILALDTDAQVVRVVVEKDAVAGNWTAGETIPFAKATAAVLRKARDRMGGRC
jgi:hypothetical protein